MFLTRETAEDIARISKTMAEQPLEIPPGDISAVMVKLEPGYDPYDVALEMMRQVPGVTPIESPNLFQAYRKQMMGLLTGILMAMAVTLVLSVVLIGLIFSMAANERRRELGVLRAMGATRNFVFKSLLTEAGLLAMGGGVAGIALTVLAVSLFHRLITVTLGIPFLLPSPFALMPQVAGGLALALLAATGAAMLPAYRISHLDPAVAMRE